MTENKGTKFQNLKKIIKAITVEPVAFLMLVGSVLAMNTTQTLSLEKACRVNLNLSEAICDAVRNQDTDDNAENERIVQEYVATLISYKSAISVLPCLILVFAGGWMDVTGRRKIMLVLPITGELFVQVNNIMNVIFFNQLKVEFLILLEGFFGSLFGGSSLLFLAVFSYITDITTEKNRTYRLGLVYFCVFIGTPIGVALSGFLLKTFGYLTVYILSLLFALTNACYIIFILSDPVRTKEHKEHDNRGFVYFMKTFFSPTHFLNSLKVVFKKTANHRALRLCVLIAATCALFGPMHGESSVMYMNTRYRFGWDEFQFSMFQTYNMVVNTIGVLFCILVISKKLEWHDSILGVTSTTSKIAASFIYCFAATGAIFYIGPAVDLVNGTSFIAMKSIFSKTVEPHEIAKLNSIVGIFEVLMPLAYVPLFTQVYIATMDFLPGFVFLMGSILTIPPLLVFIWLLYTHLRAVKTQKFKESGETS